MIWRVQKGHTAEVVEIINSYLQSHPANYYDYIDTLLELIYQAYIEFNSAETSVFKAIINPPDKILRSLVDTDEEADEYMNVVFSLPKAIGDIRGISYIYSLLSLMIAARPV